MARLLKKIGLTRSGVESTLHNEARRRVLFAQMKNQHVELLLVHLLKELQQDYWRRVFAPGNTFMDPADHREEELKMG